MQASPTIVIIDSGCANIASVRYAFERLGYEAKATADIERIQSVDRVILPGVGSAPAAMKQLNALNLIETIQNLKQPVMGICLGMQLLFKHSEEFNTDMLGIIDSDMKKFDDSIDIIPHMGWNSVSQAKPSPLFKNVPDNSHFYFVHSFRADVEEYTLGACDYGSPFSAIVQKDNFYGCQFHPERSGVIGAQVLKNFIEGDL